MIRSIARANSIRQQLQSSRRMSSPLPLQPQRGKTTVTSVFTAKSYKPFGHYSQAIKAGGQVWLSGQIAADAQGTIIQGSMAEKAQTIIQNTDNILKEAGSSLDRVVKVVVYLKDARMSAEFSKVYDPLFPHGPARSTIEVSNLPVGVDIMVDFIAVV